MIDWLTDCMTDWQADELIINDLLTDWIIG